MTEETNPPEQKLFIDSATISDSAKQDRCPDHPNATSTGGFGLAGGGYGAYNMCDVCGRVFGKTECHDE